MVFLLRKKLYGRKNGLIGHVTHLGHGLKKSLVFGYLVTRLLGINARTAKKKKSIGHPN